MIHKEGIPKEYKARVWKVGETFDRAQRNSRQCTARKSAEAFADRLLARASDDPFAKGKVQSVSAARGGAFLALHLRTDRAQANNQITGYRLRLCARH